jgi:hypothetical protein
MRTFQGSDVITAKISKRQRTHSHSSTGRSDEDFVRDIDYLDLQRCHRGPRLALLEQLGSTLAALYWRVMPRRAGHHCQWQLLARCICIRKRSVQKIRSILLKQTTNSIPMIKNARATIDNAIRKATFFDVVENIPIFSSWLKPDEWDR